MTGAERDEMAVRFQPLAAFVVRRVERSIARRGWPPPPDRADMVSAARLAVLVASRKWDAARGARFMTYAYACAKGEAIRAYRRQFWPRPFRWEKGGPPPAPADRLTRREQRAVPAGEGVVGCWTDREWDSIFEGVDRRARRVVEDRVGRYYPPATLKAVGARLGLTAERVRQIEARAHLAIRNRAGKGEIRADGFSRQGAA